MRCFASIKGDQGLILSCFHVLGSLTSRSPRFKLITVLFLDVLKNRMARHQESFISIPGRGLLFAITVYKVMLSPLFAGSCRFVPSCSSYAREAVARHGALRGSWLAVKRLVRCHPLCKGGLDQVPNAQRSNCPPKIAIGKV